MSRFGIPILILLAGVLFIYTVSAHTGQAGAEDQTLPLDRPIENIVSYVNGEAQESDHSDITVTVKFDQTAGLPTRSPDAWGVLLDQSETSYRVGIYTTRLVNGKLTCQPTDLGKETNILTTESTRFIADLTDFSQAQTGQDPTDLHVQQVLEQVKQPGKLPKCASLLVWGARQGDHILADVILYHDGHPKSLTAP